MNFGTAFKVFQLQILRSSGIMVTPQQFGLKTDPIANLQSQTMAGNFSTVLGGLNLPTPPTPPANPSDPAAQTKYQQDLLTYNNSFQLYNQRMMQMLLSQFQSMQQSMVSMQNNASSSSSAGSSASSNTPSGVGGIL